MNLHTTADSVRVDSDERGFELVIETEDGDRITVNIQPCALDFYASVQGQMRGWILEAESARAAIRAGVSLEDYTGATVPQFVRSRPMSVADAISEGFMQDDYAGYEPDDPKSPGYHDRMVGDA